MAPPNWSTTTVEVEGYNVAVREMGSGPTILAIHGLGGSGRYWTRLAVELASEFRVVAPDLLGFGDAEKPVVAYSPELFVEELEGVMRHLNAGSLRCAIGHSLGGILAVAYSASRPRPIERLALFATPFPTDPATNSRRFLRSPMKRLMVHHRLLGRLTHKVGCRLFPLLLRAVRGGRYPREILQDFHKHTHHSFTDTAERCLFRFDVRPWLGAIPDLSAFLTYSDIDREVPVADAERYATALAGSHCDIVHRDHELVPFGSEALLREWLHR